MSSAGEADELEAHLHVKDDVLLCWEHLGLAGCGRSRSRWRCGLGCALMRASAALDVLPFPLLLPAAPLLPLVAAAPLLGAARTSAINKRKGTKREKRRDPESRRNY